MRQMMLGGYQFARGFKPVDGKDSRKVPVVEVPRRDGSATLRSTKTDRLITIHGGFYGAPIPNCSDIRTAFDQLMAVLHAGAQNFQIDSDRYTPRAEARNISYKWGETGYGRYVDIAFEVLCPDPFWYSPTTQHADWAPVSYVANPTVVPTLTASTGGALPAGAYTLGYTLYDSVSGHESALGPTAVVTVAASGQVIFSAPQVLPTGVTGVNVYMSTAAGNTTLELMETNWTPNTPQSIITTPSGTAAPPSVSTFPNPNLAGGSLVADPSAVAAPGAGNAWVLPAYHVTLSGLTELNATLVNSTTGDTMILNGLPAETIIVADGAAQTVKYGSGADATALFDQVWPRLDFAPNSLAFTYGVGNLNSIQALSVVWTPRWY